MLVLAAGVLIGIGLSGVTFSVISGVLGRSYPPEKRSMVLGISAAAGSFGQFAMLPLTQWLISHVGWYGALLTLAAVGLVDGAARRRRWSRSARRRRTPSRNRPARRCARRSAHRGYVLLTVGFFVCGFQVVFVGVHLPAYLADRGLPPHVAVTALALIGLFNIVGTYTTGWLGGRMPKRYILSAIYFGRAAVIALFLWLPMSSSRSTRSPMAFGFLWLSTVPPTNGLVAQRVRRALPRDALGLHLLQPPDRQLPRRVARRLPVRPHGQLRRRLVDLDRARASSRGSSTCRSTSARSSGPSPARR